MINPAVHLGDVTHAIQLALAPAFLLTAIAGILNVMAGRLARIIDRGRHLTEGGLGPELLSGELMAQELQSLDRRRHLASRAITSCTVSALLVCTVIASLFLEVLLQLDFKWLIGFLFTGSTLGLIFGLGTFVREVHLATETVRFPVSG